MTRLYVVRHGETEWNVSRRAQGTADIALTDEGRRQAERVAELFRRHRVDAVYSSDLVRALDTARPVAEGHGVTVQAEAGLREIDQGEWEGLTTDVIRARWPELWGPARHYSPRPGGESPSQVRARALAVLERIVRRHPEQTVVIVSHGGTIRWISAEALGYDDVASAGIRGVSNGGVVVLDAHLNGDRLVLGNLHRLDGRPPDYEDPNA